MYTIINIYGYVFDFNIKSKKNNVNLLCVKRIVFEIVIYVHNTEHVIIHNNYFAIEYNTEHTPANIDMNYHVSMMESHNIFRFRFS